MMLHAAAIRRPLEVLLLLGPTPPMALWMWAPDVLEDADVGSEEEEKEAPMDQVLPGNACSGLLFALGSAVLLTHEKPPQVALPSRKAESPERPSRKVESPERPAAHDAACDALNIRRRLRGKRPAQNVRQFLPAPGSGLLPPGAPRLPFQTPKLKKRQASPRAATPDKTYQVARAEQPGGGSSPGPAEQPREKRARAKYGTAQTFVGRRPPPGGPRRGSCSTRSGPITTGRRSMIGNWADLAASTQSTNTTSS